MSARDQPSFLRLSIYSDEIVRQLFLQIHLRHSCLRNAVSMFHVIERELEWRRNNGLKEGFETLKACKPIIAVGADGPLDSQSVLADYFREWPLLGTRSP